MPSRPVSVIEFAGYRRRAAELLNPDERDAVIDLLRMRRHPVTSFPALADFEKSESDEVEQENAAAPELFTIST